MGESPKFPGTFDIKIWFLNNQIEIDKQTIGRNTSENLQNGYALSTNISPGFSLDIFAGKNV